MRTRNQSKRHGETPQGGEGLENVTVPAGKSKYGKEGSLASVSREAVGRLLERVGSRSGLKKRGQERNLMKEELSKENEKGEIGEELIQDFGLKEGASGEVEENMTCRGLSEEGNVYCDANEMDWEDGAVSVSQSGVGYSHELGKDVTVEFTDSLSPAQKKPSRRASAEDKVLAELVHEVHLLCLLARGRLVDRACNDPLIQASLLSLLPQSLSKLTEDPKLTADRLCSLVKWFHDNFHLQDRSIDRGSFMSNLAYALETHGGTAEEVAALSVALFRALNLTTRFISILDVASLKPDVEVSGCLIQDGPRLDTKISSFPANVTSPNQVHDLHPLGSSPNSSSPKEAQQASRKGKRPKKKLLIDLANSCRSDEGNSVTKNSKVEKNDLDVCGTKSAEGSKRKGDLEFELQLEMALSATAGGPSMNNVGLNISEAATSWGASTHPAKKVRNAKSQDSPVASCSTSSAVWSRKLGPPLYWAEVYCNGENLTGRWVHVDATSAIVDGEDKVEAAAAAYRRPLKYVVAFAGNGAKDVTRRYCTQWYKIAPQRTSSHWWEKVLAPLKELESIATGGEIQLETFLQNASLEMEQKAPEALSAVKVDARDPIEDLSSQKCSKPVTMAMGPGKEPSKKLGQGSCLNAPAQCAGFASRTSLEDMELETRALTEPLPTNQLAYKNHHLYAIERWLTKYQILHPKGPLLGYCSGHPVYPRFCVRTLQTKQKWLREGLQVKANEVPAKVVKHSKRFGKVQISELGTTEDDIGEATLELYGKWQMEPLCLPHAINGIVPRNERGQVDVWSEKCLPPGTVHLRFPRLVPVVKRLGIDFAPAMVGFEYRSGRSFPVFEGLVVCTEFKEAIMEAYAEEEEKREADEKKLNEAQALSRWFQLISSIVTRQRLQNSYAESSSTGNQNSTSGNVDMLPRISCQESVHDSCSVLASSQEHEHVFPLEDQSFDELSLIRTKRCPCGFSIQLEEL